MADTETTPTVQAPRTPATKLPESRLTIGWVRLPSFVRSFVIDAVEGAVASISVVTVLNLVQAGSVAEAQAQAIVIATTIGGPVVAAFRRRIVPGVAGWLVRTFPRPE